MQFVRNVFGGGMLMADGVPVGPCGFHFEVYGDGRSLECKGKISAPHECLWKAFSAGKSSIVRSDTKYEIQIVINDYSGGSDEAFAQVSGSPE
jgi:hypothetical protein